jgi:hypothetical protein
MRNGNNFCALVFLSVVLGFSGSSSDLSLGAHASDSAESATRERAIIGLKDDSVCLATLRWFCY